MNINRHNYEEYFLLYVDHELSADDRAAVELFVQENPDLREELRMLEDTVIRPEKKIVFFDKASLLKSGEDVELINESNFEEYFILYGDDELSNTEKDSVEQFVYKNPQHQASFELFQQARVSADKSILFPDKQSLYRSEKDERVVVMRWWKIAVAAAVILMLGTTALYLGGFIGKGKVNPSEFARKTGDTKDQSTTPPAQQLPNNVVEENSQENMVQAPNNSSSPASEKTGTLNLKQVNPSPVKSENLQAQQPKEEVLVENSPKKSENNSNLSNPTNVQQIETSVAVNTNKVPAKIEPAVVLNSTEADRVFAALNVNDPKDNEVLTASNDDQIEVLTTSVSNKGKMRGFFRKVGRVVNKATNFGNSAEKDTDKKGVRIANFEIALK